MGNDSIEFEGKNVDVAVWKASQELNVAIEDMNFKILTKGRRGRGDDEGEPARIRVFPAGQPAPEPDGEAAAETEATPGRSSATVEAAAETGAAEDLDEEDEDREEELEEDEDREEEQEEDEDREEEQEEDEDREEEQEEDDEPLDEDLDVAPSGEGPLPEGMEEDDPIEEARRARRARRARPPQREEEAGAPEGDGAEPDDEPLEEPRPGPAPARDRPRRRARAERREEPAGIEDLEGGIERAREFLPALIRDLGFDLSVDYELRDDHVYIPMEGDDGDHLLGERAEGLNALQYLLNKMVYRGGPARLVLDVNGYRKERQEELVARALDLARQVRDTGDSRTLGPMNPFERRLVHLALRDDDEVRTMSHGDSFMKKLEIAPRHGSGRGSGHDGPRSRPRGRRGGGGGGRRHGRGSRFA